MKRFKRILFVNDGKVKKGAALEKAVNLAKTNQALLTLVEILAEYPQETPAEIEPLKIKDIEEIALRESAERLENLTAGIKEEGVQVNSKVLRGTDFLEIIREVLRNNHDLVMLSPRKKAKFKDVLFGSRIMHLMRKCPCPVWAIKPSKHKKYDRILAAVDPGPFNDERNALNIKIMELATSLARLEASDLYVVHCWSSALERGRHNIGVYTADMKRLVRETRKIHKMNLDRFLKPFDLERIPHRVHLLKGDPGDLIVETAKKKRVDLVVMGTVCRTGLAGFFIGNTAENVLHQIDCSILAIKPDGFVTPVKLEEDG